MRRRIFVNGQTEAWLFQEPGGRRSSGRSDQIREALAEFLHLSPADLSFAQGRFDRPRLVCRSADCGLVDFSVSHCADGFALIMSRERKVGIDISAIDPDFDFESVSEELFSTREKEGMQNFSGEARRREFFRIWSRKEALLKCLGLGMQASLRETDVLDSHVPVTALPELSGPRRMVELVSLAEAGSPVCITLALGPAVS